MGAVGDGVTLQSLIERVRTEKDPEQKKKFAKLLARRLEQINLMHQLLRRGDDA